MQKKKKKNWGFGKKWSLKFMISDSPFNEENWQNVLIKGVLHPRSVFGLFLHFSQKPQHIGNK